MQRPGLGSDILDEIKRDIERTASTVADIGKSVGKSLETDTKDGFDDIKNDTERGFDDVKKFVTNEIEDVRTDIKDIKKLLEDLSPSNIEKDFEIAGLILVALTFIVVFSILMHVKSHRK